MHYRCFIASALVSVAGCTQRTYNNARIEGLSTSPSNLELPKGAEVEGFRFLDNTHVPKGILVSASLNGNPEVGYSSDSANSEYLRQLYRIVKSINTSDGLAGLDGPKQEITLAIMTPQDSPGQKPEEAEPMKRLLAEIRAEHGYADKIPYLIVYAGNAKNFPWMQDLGEIGVAKIKGTNHLVPTFLDTHYYGVSQQNVDNDMVKAMRDAFHLPIIKAKLPSDTELSDGNRGGNLESTPDGDVLVGNRITPQLEEYLKQITGKKVIKVPTDFLLVGHVDEIFSFVPSQGRCGQSLVYADALEGLQLFATDTTGSWEPTGQAHARESLKRFYKGDLSAPLKIENFNTKISVRKDPDNSASDLMDDVLTLGAVNAQKQILAGLKIIKDNVSCLDAVIPLPVYYTADTEITEFHLGDRLTAATPFVNHIVLRDHLVVSAPTTKRAKKIVEDRLGAAVGGKSKLHFIDTSWYDMQMGSAHCSTLVVRDAEHRISVSPGTNPQAPQEIALTARVGTWFKHTTDQGPALPETRRCKLEPGQKIFSQETPPGIGRATHVRVVLSRAIPGCPAGKTGTRGFVWGEHIQN